MTSAKERVSGGDVWVVRRKRGDVEGGGEEGGRRFDGGVKWQSCAWPLYLSEGREGNTVAPRWKRVRVPG